MIVAFNIRVSFRYHTLSYISDAQTHKIISDYATWLILASLQ